MDTTARTLRRTAPHARPGARARAAARAVPLVAVLALGLGACAGDASDASGTATTSSQESGSSEPAAAESEPTASGSVGSDVNEGDGDEPAETSELSTLVGQSATFTATVVERIGDHSLAVSAPEAGVDPVLVYGALLPGDLGVDDSVDVEGVVQVYDPAAAVERYGQAAVGPGTERFAGTPAVVAGTAATFTP